MRKLFLVGLVGLVLAGGIGVAVAQLGGEGEEELDLSLPKSSPSPEDAVSDEAVSDEAKPEEPSPDPTASPEDLIPPELRAPGSGSTKPSAPAAANRPGSTTGNSGSSDPGVASTHLPSSPDPAPAPFEPQSKVVQPRPGMENLRKTGWERVEVLDDTRIRVHFVSGVEPCTVLDHVEVEYRQSEIVVTLYEGNDPSARETACIMIAMYKAVDVELSQPVNGRTFADGAQ